MKLWIDACRPAPLGYVWARSVDGAKDLIIVYSEHIDFDNNIVDEVELIDIDHDAGDYIRYGGEYIELLEWLEETNRNYPIHIHSTEPVEIENMRRIIERNGWKEVF